MLQMRVSTSSTQQAGMSFAFVVHPLVTVITLYGVVGLATGFFALLTWELYRACGLLYISTLVGVPLPAGSGEVGQASV